MQVYGADCQRSACAEGRKCELLEEPRLPGKVWLECVVRCGEGFPACAPGTVCDGWSCEPACDPSGPNPCAEGYRCLQRWREDVWACRPDR